jgi:hypothetical protein
MQMKLTNQDLDILQELLQQKIKKIANGPEGIETHEREEIYINIMKKLDRMYFQ